MHTEAPYLLECIYNSGGTSIWSHRCPMRRWCIMMYENSQAPTSVPYQRQHTSQTQTARAVQCWHGSCCQTASICSVKPVLVAKSAASCAPWLQNFL